MTKEMALKRLEFFLNNPEVIIFGQDKDINYALDHALQDLADRVLAEEKKGAADEHQESMGV